MIQEPLGKENLGQDELEKCFNRKSNEHLTQNEEFLWWDQSGAFCVAEANPHCSTAVMSMACL